MHVIFVEIELMGNLLVREVQAHKIEAENPNPQGLMMTRKDGVGQIVKASLTGCAQITLTLGLGVVTPLFRHLRAVARWTLDTIGPA